MVIRNHIAGVWVDPRGTEQATRRDPADARSVVSSWTESTADDVARAVEAARAALPAWRAFRAPARAAVLRRAAAALAAEREPLAELLTREEGKTRAESNAELVRAAEALEFCAGETLRMAGETLPSEVPGRLVMTVREPVGVAGLITPWNYPAQLAAWKIGPALAAGNTVVFKPSELTPAVSARLVELLAAALRAEGAPPGTLNLVIGSGAVAGAALAAHPGVDAISFTGSAQGGAAVRAAAGPRGIPLLCEMGGKNPLVVLEDADLELAVDACVRGAFGNAGQRCTATSRAIVVPAVAERFESLLVARTAALSVGPGIDPASVVGPLSSDRALARTVASVEAARSSGARVLCGGKRPAREACAHGWFHEPTVLAGLPPDDPIAQEELFGPVLLLQHARDEDEALSIANGVRYGLSASVYTRDLDRALRFARGFEAGIVHVNSPTVGGETHVPFGGRKNTGNGPRERGRASVDFFTRWKTIYVDTR